MQGNENTQCLILFTTLEQVLQKITIFFAHQHSLRQCKHIPIATVPKYFSIELLAVVSYYENHNRKCGQTARWSVPGNMEKQFVFMRRFVFQIESSPKLRLYLKGLSFCYLVNSSFIFYKENPLKWEKQPYLTLGREMGLKARKVYFPQFLGLD